VRVCFTSIGPVVSSRRFARASSEGVGWEKAWKG